MVFGFVCMSAALPLLVVPRTVPLQALALVFVGAAGSFAVVPTLPFMTDEISLLGATSFETVYSIFNTAYAIGNIIVLSAKLFLISKGPIVGLSLQSTIGLLNTYIIIGSMVAPHLVMLTQKNALYVFPLLFCGARKDIERFPSPVVSAKVPPIRSPYLTSRRRLSQQRSGPTCDGRRSRERILRTACPTVRRRWRDARLPVVVH